MDDDLSWYKLYRPLHVLYPVSPLVVKKDSTEPAWLHLHISGEVIDMTLIHVLCCFSMMFIFAICLPSHRLQFHYEIFYGTSSKYMYYKYGCCKQKTSINNGFHVFYSHHHESDISVCLAAKFSELFSLHHHATTY